MNDNQHDNPMDNNDDLSKVLDEGGLQFEETPVGNDSNNQQHSDNNASPTMDPMSLPSDSDDQPTDAHPDTQSHNLPTPSAPGSSDLDALKASALDDLRPLVGKLGLKPKDKFDTLLLIIRSTDDQSLLKQAHEAAKKISNDSERAQALLEVIKEVDYFKSK